MKIYTANELKEKTLNTIPKFEENAGGVNPYITRLDKGISVKTGFLKRIKRIDITGKTTITVDGPPWMPTYISTFEKTIQHNMGAYPYPLGQLKIGEYFFPMPFPGEPGIEITVTYKDVGKDKFTLYITSAVFTEVQDIKARLYLLRETLT